MGSRSQAAMKSLLLLLSLLLAGPLVSAFWGTADSDEDGIIDAEDDDDDNDGLLDVEDDDDDVDGIADEDEDNDGDGLSNDEDEDDDGDGVLEMRMTTVTVLRTTKTPMMMATACLIN